MSLALTTITSSIKAISVTGVVMCDIDGIPTGKDDQGNFIKQAVPPEIRTALLDGLGLPASYDWSGPSSCAVSLNIERYSHDPR